MRNFLLTALTFILISGSVYSQAPTDSLNQSGKSVVIKDTTNTKQKRALNPMTASLLSTFVPGAGQIYNRKYWKAPIVWGGAAGLYLMYDFYNRKHHFYHQILIYKDRGGTDSYIIPFAQQYGGEFTTEPAATIAGLSQSDVQLRNDAARKRKQQVIVGATIFYVLQIVDATVDAHFSQFDVSEDLSLNVSPAYFQSAPYAQGVKLSFSF